MHRGLRMSMLLLMALLVACQQGAPTIRWLSPTSGGTLSGQVRLSVEPLGESAPPNVVFMLEDKEVAKAYLADDIYEAILDTSVIEPGNYTMRAVPYGAPSVPLEVSVARSVSETPDTVTGTPETPSDTGSSLGSDPLNLGGLLDLWGEVGGGSTAEAALYAPGAFPWESLWRGSAVRAKARGFLTQQQAAVIELPRGDYRYNEALEAWEGSIADAGSLMVTFSYPDPETLEPHEIVITVDWENARKTQVVESQLGEVEVPTATRVYVTDNGEAIMDLDILASWRKPEGCAKAILEPEELSLIGYSSHARPNEDGDSASPAQDDGEEAPERPDIDESEVELRLTLGTDPVSNEDTLELALELVTLAGEAQADLSLEVAASGKIEREDCFASGGTLSNLLLSTEVGVGLVDGPRKGSRFSAQATEPEYNQDGVPTSALIEGEVATFDEATLEEDVSSYSGRLDDESGDGFPGENVTVTLPEGDEMTLDVYIKAIFEIYRAMIEEKIGESR